MMLSNDAVRFLPLALLKRPAFGGLLACLCALTAACARDRVPGEPPNPGQTDSADPMDDATEESTPADARAGRFPIGDAAHIVIDAGRAMPTVDSPVGLPADPGGPPPFSGASGSDAGTASGVGASGSLPAGFGGGAGAAPALNALDAGVTGLTLPTFPGGLTLPMLPTNLTLPTLPEDAGFTVECARALAGCIIRGPLAVDRCLEQYSHCEPYFNGDAGRYAGCATRFAACIVDDPLGIERCLPDLGKCIE